MYYRLIAFLLLLICSGVVPADEGADYEQNILPLFREHCFECHSGTEREGGLNLEEEIVVGGISGAVVVPGHAEQSLLLELVRSGEMPPGEDSRLPDEQVAQLEQWISAGAALPGPQQFPKVDGDRIQALLLLRCAVCHGAERQEAGLDLRTRDGILKGGKSGHAAVPGHPEQSLLLRKIEAGEMAPPRRLVEVSIKPITSDETELLRDWIAGGMPAAAEGSRRAVAAPPISEEERAFWSFVPPVAVELPDVKSDEHVLTALDLFVQQRLEQEGLSLSPPADKVTLIRRVYLAITGLPPTWEQVQEVLQDTEEQPIAHLIHELVDSPQFGVRWGRYWLDAAGYADSEGAQNEDRVRKDMWRYRDYVIRSFNDDKPYDRFLQEQLAGDELAPWEGVAEIDQTVADNLAATGFLRLTPDRTFANITAFVPDRLEVIADELQVLGSAVMGLTIGCARCHAHKFDPISQEDYYRLSAVFKDAFDEHDWLKSQGQRTLTVVSTAERTEWEQRKQSLEQRIAELRGQQEGADEEAKKALEQQIGELQKQIPEEPRIRALWSRGRPSPTWVLLRGNYLTPGKRVEPGVPAVLSEAGGDLQIVPPWEGATATGRRLAFARWLTDRRNPLTARVIVNRVWMHLFGSGLVDTPENFGVTGSRPSHPELLDWLAVNFMENRWSIKSLVRIIMYSAAWQQPSQGSEESVARDPDGRLFSRGPLTRMDAETLRDSLLFVSGALSERMYGPPDQLDVRADGLVTVRPDGDQWRRSAFVMMRRTQIPSLLESFDYPQMGPNCVQRSESIVAPQALQLLNGNEVHQLSQRLADLVLLKCGQSAPLSGDPAARQQRIQAVHRQVLSREPRPEELQVLLDAYAQLAEQWVAAERTAEEAELLGLRNLCHALLNSAAFVMVE